MTLLGLEHNIRVCNINIATFLRTNNITYGRTKGKRCTNNFLYMHPAKSKMLQFALTTMIYIVIPQYFNMNTIPSKKYQCRSTLRPCSYTAELMIMVSHLTFSSQFYHLTEQTKFDQTNLLYCTLSMGRILNLQ